VARSDIASSFEINQNVKSTDIVDFKSNTIKYAKVQDTGVTERHCGPPPSEKIITKWRRQVEDLQKFEKNERCLQAHYKKA
jgi:hypothetical protein